MISNEDDWAEPPLDECDNCHAVMDGNQAATSDVCHDCWNATKRRADSAEAELREATGELAIQRDMVAEAVRAQNSAMTRLTEATALLEQIRAALTGVHVMNSQDAGRVVCAWVVEDVLDMFRTPVAVAPSQAAVPTPVLCTVHADIEHGKEAEELRAGLEELIEHDDVGTSTVLALLDRIDARDSLAYSERQPAHAEGSITNDVFAGVMLAYRLKIQKAREIAQAALPDTFLGTATNEAFKAIIDALHPDSRPQERALTQTEHAGIGAGGGDEDWSEQPAHAEGEGEAKAAEHIEVESGMLRAGNVEAFRISVADLRALLSAHGLSIVPTAPAPGVCTPAERAVLDACAALPDKWIDDGLALNTTTFYLCKAELARRNTP